MSQQGLNGLALLSIEKYF